MKHLYLNNFRGFNSCFIPIADVNICVGENSTGKTSVLSILKLLSESDVWFGRAAFENDQIHLGGFRDIISSTAHGKRHFQVGIVERLPSGQAQGFLMTYREREGQPYLSHYSHFVERSELHIRLTQNSSRAKRRNFDSSPSVDELKNEFFGRWLAEHDSPTSGYKVYHSPLGSTGLVSTLFSIQASFHSEEVGIPSVQLPVPRFGSELVWIAPIRSRPKRVYDTLTSSFSAEGAHTPFVIRKQLSKKTNARRFVHALRDIGESTGLFKSIEIKTFGKSIDSPFTIEVGLAGGKYGLDRVGYGVSQALPVIVEFILRREDSWFAVQQPEVHLHPRAQAGLGDLVIELAASEGKRFFIETHSDFLIDRFRLGLKTREVSFTSQILFFSRDKVGNSVVAIPIQADGELPSDQPPEYREFFIREQLRILGV